jgi:type IV secretion system protein VirB8
MFAKNKASPKVDSAVSRSVNFELTIADRAKRSEKRAWAVAWCAVVMSLILAGGYFYMLPLKEKVPYLVMADAYSGNATVARLEWDYVDRRITASEAINRSNVSNFVMARESYDIALLTMRDWTTVYTMSTPEVASGYTALHSRNNPNSPYAQYGASRAIRVRILSIVFDGEKGMTPRGATVRIQRSIYDKSTGASRPLDSKIATLAFKYNDNLKMSEKDRIENPLGFQVTAYRVDTDYASSPPLETVAPLEAAPAAPAAPPAFGQSEYPGADGTEALAPTPDPATFISPDAANPAVPAATPAPAQQQPAVPQR